MSLISSGEKQEIIHQMLVALDNTDLKSVYSISREQSQRSSNYYRERMSIPGNRERKQERDRKHKRKVNNSTIDPNSPSTQHSYHRSPLEIEYESDIVEFFSPCKLEFNIFPLFLYNPLTRGRMEADCLNLTNQVIIEVHEKPHKTK